MPHVDPPGRARRRPGRRLAADHRSPCPCCGGRMIIVETFERCGAPRAPPSPDAGSGPRCHDPVTASSHHAPAGEPNFRRRIAIASAPPKAVCAPPIMPKTPVRAWRAGQIPTPIVVPAQSPRPEQPSPGRRPTNPHKRHTPHPAPAVPSSEASDAESDQLTTGR